MNLNYLWKYFPLPALKNVVVCHENVNSFQNIYLEVCTLFMLSFKVT